MSIQQAVSIDEEKRFPENVDARPQQSQAPQLTSGLSKVVSTSTARVRHTFTNPTASGWRNTLFLAASSLGIIYGDIGTSPLYVLNAVFPSSGPAPSERDVLGAVSAVLWTITIVPLIKYALVALEFGTTHGEGGPFAIFTSLYPPLEETDDGRALTTYTTASVGQARRRRVLDNPIIRTLLFTLVVFGTCLTMSDGLLTPAVSVVSAVQGIAVAAPGVANSVVGISVAILVILFLAQSFGTHRISFLFAPIVFIWLTTCGISGIINITQHPGIFRAFDPSEGVMLFVRTKNFDLLAGILLAITGVEALFANLGQFSKGSIRLAFGCFVYPCLVLAYLGQGAKLIIDGDRVIKNVFFQSVPGGVGTGYWWFSWIFAVLAAVIASQAMISATFSLVQQLTRLHAMPAVKIIHTSSSVSGQVFVPAVNLLCMVGTIAVTVGFGTDAGLTNAYGFAVAGVMFITTCFISIAFVDLKRFPIIFGLAFFIVAGFVDCLFFGASFKKVPHGAWFPLGLAAVLGSGLLFYSWAKRLEMYFDATHRHRLGEVMRLAGAELKHDDGHAAPARDTAIALKPQYQAVGSSAQLVRLPVFALFHNSSATTLNGAPHSFSAFLRCYPSLPQVVIFFNCRVVGIPHTEDEERLVVSRVRSFQGIYTCTLRLGYRDPIDLSNIAEPIKKIIVHLERRSNDEGLEDRIAATEHAFQNSVTHILPHFHVSSSPDATSSKFTRACRKFFIESLYRRVAINFDEYDQFQFGNEEDVLRMGVSAAL